MSKIGSNSTATTVQAPASAPNYLGGIALRLLAMLSVSIMFVIVKLLDQSGVHVLESLFWRQALVLPFLLIWIGSASVRTCAARRWA
jgi:hypothetical protein